MDNNTVIRAVTEDTSGILDPVLYATYQLSTKPPYDMAQIAVDVNNALGYVLFDQLGHPQLSKDFAVVSRAIQRNAIKGDVNEFREENNQ